MPARADDHCPVKGVLLEFFRLSVSNLGCSAQATLREDSKPKAPQPDGLKMPEACSKA